MNPSQRPDLSELSILLLLVMVISFAIAVLLWSGIPSPGSFSGQLCASAGALLLLTPLLFVVMKRSGWSASPPGWFVAHVLATVTGCCLIFIHVAGGDWNTPPGLVLLLLVLLILQGSALRVIFSRGFSLLFARNSTAQGFGAPENLDKLLLGQLIEGKIDLLQKLDPAADEALFSPALKHWLRHPLASGRYQLLAEREARMLGARRSAGIELGWSRRIHMLAAAGFYLGLFAHVIVMLFFAGYAADGADIDWWYITAWGA